MPTKLLPKAAGKSIRSSQFAVAKNAHKFKVKVKSSDSNRSNNFGQVASHPTIEGPLKAKVDL